MVPWWRWTRYIIYIFAKLPGYYAEMGFAQVAIVGILELRAFRRLDSQFAGGWGGPPPQYCTLASNQVIKTAGRGRVGGGERNARKRPYCDRVGRLDGAFRSLNYFAI